MNKALSWRLLQPLHALPSVWCGALTFCSMSLLFVALFYADGLQCAAHAAAASPRTPTASVGSHTNTPLLALVIDDWGNPSTAAPRFLEMGVPLTAAIIPGLPASQKHAAAAAAAGFDVIMHLPMEPENPRLRSADMVSAALSDQAIADLVQAALQKLPGVVGVSNHMGSKASTDARVMQAVLRVLQAAGLFYLDSHTAQNTLGPTVALRMGVPVLLNDMFIDNRANVAYIRQQLLRAASIARRNGAAVAIGHVRPVTARVLAATLPELRQQGVRLVRLSELLSVVPMATSAAPARGTISD